jgi:hypothetical protein
MLYFFKVKTAPQAVSSLVAILLLFAGIMHYLTPEHGQKEWDGLSENEKEMLRWTGINVYDEMYSKQVLLVEALKYLKALCETDRGTARKRPLLSNGSKCTEARYKLALWRESAREAGWDEDAIDAATCGVDAICVGCGLAEIFEAKCE